MNRIPASAKRNATAAAEKTASGFLGAEVSTHSANAENNTIKGTDVNSTLFQNWISSCVERRRMRYSRSARQGPRISASTSPLRAFAGSQTNALSVEMEEAVGETGPVVACSGGQEAFMPLMLVS